MKKLEASLVDAGIPVEPMTLERFDAFFQLIEEGNKRANLTGVSGWEAVRDELLIRSLLVAPMLNDAKPGDRLIDIGTGAGIPGLFAKIAYPHLNVTLVDATRKKIDFLAAAISALDLSDASAIHARAEDLARQPAHRESYEFATARAVGSLSVLAELLLPFVVVGGTAAALKSAGVEAEAERAEFAVSEMGGGLVEITSPAGSDDALVVWRKAGATPSRYPRRAGIPHKTPLAAPAAKSAAAGTSPR